MNFDEFIRKFGLFYERGSFEFIHADWPIYPMGHGVRSALETLGNFPQGTKFSLVDEIDQCNLFVADVSKNTNDLYDYYNFHVAIWHKDLMMLHEYGWISGMRLVTAYEAALDYYEHVKLDPSWTKDGKLIVPEPRREMFEDPDKSELQIVDSISISEKGFQELLDFSSPLRILFHPALESRITPLIIIGYFDTAVREGCLLIESKLREITGTEFYGQPLIDCFLKQWKESEDGNMSTSWKIIRGELRTVFKFLRNHYAHNFMSIDQNQSYTMLVRISRILRALDAVNWKT